MEIRKLCLCWSVLAVALAAPAVAAPVNVAHLYGSATANQAYLPMTHGPGRAIDNDFQTYWVAPDHGSTANPNWLVVDLGASFVVDSIEVFAPGHDGHYHGLTTIWSLFHGLDGLDWTMIGSGTFIDEDPAAASAEFVFNPGVAMRYVKYEVNGGTHWSNVGEIHVWSDQTPPSPVPEPATLLLMGLGMAGLGLMRRRKA